VKALETNTALTRLSLAGCKKITGGLGELADSCHALSDVNLSGSGITEEAFEFLLQAEVPLQTLNLSRCPQMRRHVWEAIDDYDLPSLTELNISWCKVSDAAVEAVARLPALAILNLSGCEKVTDDSMHWLRECSTLKKLVLNGRDDPDPFQGYFPEGGVSDEEIALFSNRVEVSIGSQSTW